MLKAGFIRKLSAGIYSYLPLGLRVLRKVSDLIRSEMDSSGALELLLPALHPADLWKQTGRYEALGQDKIAFLNRSGQEFVLGPTHEEVITEVAAAYLKSHRDLPKILYQIQTKFRDELRPRFGIIRTKEFIMKDAYSFDRDEAGLDASYAKMYAAYERIFKRLGISFDVVSADPGVMGGNASHEFMIRSPFGEDHLAICSNQSCGYVSGCESAVRKVESQVEQTTMKPIEKFSTVGVSTVNELTKAFGFTTKRLVKTILYRAGNQSIAVCVRGDREVNEGKLRKLAHVQELRLANAQEIEQMTGAPLGFSGPVNLKQVNVIADFEIPLMNDFVTGANEKDMHFQNVNYKRDFTANLVGDVCYAAMGDACAECASPLSIVTAMEVGHVFKLGKRYSEPLNARFRNETDEEKPIVMGCYGIGVNRVVAAVIEQHHDAKGMCFPVSIAPYDIHLITVNHDDVETKKAGDEVYSHTESEGFGVLYDDRNERAGVKFNDADLIGCPVQVIVSARNLSKNEVEVKIRKEQKSLTIPRANLIGQLKTILAS